MYGIRIIIAAIMIIAFTAPVALSLEVEPFAEFVYKFSDRVSVKGLSFDQQANGRSEPRYEHMVVDAPPSYVEITRSNVLMDENLNTNAPGFRVGANITFWEPNKWLKLKLGPEFSYSSSTSSQNERVWFEELEVIDPPDYIYLFSSDDVTVSSDIAEYQLGLMLVLEAQLVKWLKGIAFVGPTANCATGKFEVNERRKTELNGSIVDDVRYHESESFSKWAAGISFGAGLKANLQSLLKKIGLKNAPLQFYAKGRYNLVPGDLEKEVGYMTFKKTMSSGEISLGLSYPF